eukprot:20817-Heterococcus_DN1.PRE.1
MFGFCLTFYEKLAADRRSELQAACDEWEKLYRSVCDAPAAAVPPLAVDTPMYTPKCLCLLSSWPYFTSYREWLTNLFLISLSPAAVPIERYICNFMLEVPNAVPGRSVSSYHYSSADTASIISSDKAAVVQSSASATLRTLITAALVPPTHA